VTIARHLHVNYDALLELNQIDDPRKLQIGQKLRIPAAMTITKHNKPD
jgi:nucleoid-associated protein YgaU